jgi:hypothetical protein
LAEILYFQTEIRVAMVAHAMGSWPHGPTEPAAFGPRR